MVAFFGLLSVMGLLVGTIMALFRRFRMRGALVCVASVMTLMACVYLDHHAAVEAGFEGVGDRQEAAQAGFDTAAVWRDYKAAKAVDETKAAEIVRKQAERKAAEVREVAARAAEARSQEEQAARDQTPRTTEQELRPAAGTAQPGGTKTSDGSWLATIGWALFVFAVLGGIGALFNAEVRLQALQGAGGMFALAIVLISIGSIGAGTEAPTGSDCGIDPHCLGDEKRSEIRAACSPLIERHAKIDYEWTSGMFSPRFPINRWKNADYTTLVAMGDALKFQNGFGAWMPVNYACAYNIRTSRVEWVEVTEGRLR